MSIKGGARPGAGRKKGVPNKASAERQRAIAESGVTPLDYLLEVMRNPNNSAERRLDAAKAAAPYVHPRLAAVEMKADVDASVEVTRIELVPVVPQAYAHRD